MQPATATYLTHLTQQTYQTQADYFSHTRRQPWPGWYRLNLPSSQPLTVLDLGCGNGRFYSFLTAKLSPAKLVYLGLDFSSALITTARQKHPAAEFRLIPADSLTANLYQLDQVLAHRRFDLIAVFGLLHHLPGCTQRQNLIHHLLGRLTLSGQLVLTLWQFAHHPQLKKKIISAGRLRLPNHILTDLEPDDHLISFGNRYPSARLANNQPNCFFAHHFSDHEIACLIHRLPPDCTVSAQYKSDFDHTNHYLILQRKTIPAVPPS